MSAPEPASPDTNLVNLVLALLTPMFLWATEGDIRLAHIAAAQTLNEFRITNRLSLFTVAKIIAFDIATLSSLSLSMYEDVTMLLALRLRGNATSLDRSADRNRRMYHQETRTAAPDQTEDAVETAIAEAQRMVNEAKARIHAAAQPAEKAQPDAEPVAEATQAPAPLPLSSAPTSEQQHRSAWPDTMTAVAEAFTADLDNVPPEAQWREMTRIMAMTAAAADIAPGTASLPVAAMAAEQTDGVRPPS
jgi:hypothetical protein